MAIDSVEDFGPDRATVRCSLQVTGRSGAILVVL
jgi:hypothetical protein